MYCTLCHSSNGSELSTEMMIHFSGLKNIDKPGVLAFPKVSVCMDCGFSEFTTPETELRALREGIAPSEAAQEPLAVAA